MVNPKPVNTVKVVLSKEHFDLALARWFYSEINELCPLFCPHSHRVCKRSRKAISDGLQCGSRWYSERLRMLDEQPVFGESLVVRKKI